MSSESPRQANLEQLFPFQIKNCPHPISARESYDLDLLGFVCEIPMLTTEAASQSEAPQPVPLLQGKKVIVKTNSMSGEKSLIFKQKTGESFEIPARRCSFVKSDTTVENVGHSLKVIESAAALEAATARHKPTILKRQGRLRYQIIDLVNEKPNVAGGDQGGINGVKCMQKKLIDHNYSVASNDRNMSAKGFLKTAEAEVSWSDPIMVEAESHGVVERKDVTNDRIERKPAGFEVLNGKLAKSTDLSQNADKHLVIMARNAKVRSYPAAKKPKKVEKGMQTTSVAPQVRTAATNTEDFLLQDFITSRIQEEAVQQPTPVSIEFALPSYVESPAQKCFTAGSERVAQSPVSLMGDNDLIMDLCNFYDDSALKNAAPIIGHNANFGTGPVMGGKCVDGGGKSVNNYGSQLLDISYPRGSWPAHNAGSNILASNGRQSHLEPWKVHFFLDLKHCNQFDSYGNMPLHVAVMENNANLVRRQCFALRIRNINIDTLNHNSLTALQLAVLHDANISILQTLINHSANTSILDAEGNTLLHLAVMHSCDAVVQMLLGTCPSLAVDASNFEGDTALILCVIHEKYVKADKILQAGANPNIGDKKSGRTPLFHAVEANNVEMVKILLNYKAQTKMRNFFGTSPHDAIFELDSIDKTIRKLVLNKDYVPYKQRSQSKERKKRKEPEERSPSSKSVKVKTERTLEKVVRRKS